MVRLAAAIRSLHLMAQLGFGDSWRLNCPRRLCRLVKAWEYYRRQQIELGILSPGFPGPRIEMELVLVAETHWQRGRAIEVGIRAPGFLGPLRKEMGMVAFETFVSWILLGDLAGWCEAWAELRWWRAPSPLQIDVVVVVSGWRPGWRALP